MTNLIMYIVTALYALQSGVYLQAGNVPQAGMIFCYAIANVCIIWSTLK